MTEDIVVIMVVVFVVGVLYAVSADWKDDE
jgi:hypothetical protein